MLHIVNGTNSPLKLASLISFTFTYHTWQFIFTIFTVIACIFSYSFSLSF